MDINLVFQQSDVVLIGTFCVLIFMSILSWSIFIWRAWHLFKAKQLVKQQQKWFWDAETLEVALLVLSPAHCPLAQVGHAAINAKNKSTTPTIAHSQAIFNQHLLHQMQYGLKQSLRPFQRGLSTLASIGATAPFIGLFGTVWGIYHALINLGLAQDIGIRKVGFTTERPALLSK